MRVQVALADIDPDLDPHPPWAIAWLPTLGPEAVTAPLAAAVREQLGGMEVVVVAHAADGDCHAFGEGERSRLAATLNPWRLNWTTFAISLGGEPGLAAAA